MEQQQLDFFRTQLKSQREQVLTDIANHQPSSDPINGNEEKADRAADNLVETRITENDGNLLQKIAFALERLDAGTYQQCNHCAEQIPLERLKAKPSVSLCVGCQEKKDSGQL
jgi:DnaK suppressor protein